MLPGLKKINLDSLKIENIYNAYLGLNPREQTIALVVAAIVSVLVIILPVMIASGRITKLENDVEYGKKQLKEIMRTIESYDARKVELTQMEQMLSGGYDSSLTTTIELIADKNGIKDRIDSLKEKPATTSEIYDESSVDVRMKGLVLQQIVDFLYAIENDPEKLLRLKSLSIRPRYGSKSDFDVSFTVSTYRLLEGAQEGT